ncbi:putative phenazine biosynthesis protein [Agrocybe pediades]|nr:putative phenazine biosynthesis protein [Agrocybe pediades]
MASRLSFITLDVFTDTRFLGNPLAIVRVPKNLTNELTQEDKQTIAREFDLSETVFLHEGDLDSPVTIDIFTPNDELPFAGHPTVGSGWYLLKQNPKKETVTLQTKAGTIPVVRGKGGKVYLEVPVNFKIHAPYKHPRMKAVQSQLKGEDYVNGMNAEPVVSIVKGMTFFLVEVKSEEALAKFHTFSERLKVPDVGDWGAFIGLYAFYQRPDGVVRTRMFADGIEDPATGSAASTLGGYLATKRAQGTHKINILQGVEMGRKSDIELVVEVGNNKEIVKIQLGGGAVEVMEGTVIPA